MRKDGGGEYWDKLQKGAGVGAWGFVVFSFVIGLLADINTIHMYVYVYLYVCVYVRMYVYKLVQGPRLRLSSVIGTSGRMRTSSTAVTM